MSFFHLLTCLVMAFCTTNALTQNEGTNARQESKTNLTRIVQTASLTPTIVHKFPQGTWVENLAIRQSDGNVVVTILSSPDVYLVSSASAFEPVLLAHFPGNLGCAGIVEVGLNIFYAVVGNYSVSTTEATPGSWSIWKVDLTEHHVDHAHQGHIVTTQVAVLPAAGFLNGMTVLDPHSGTVLVADSLYSAVWSVNVWSGHVAIAINDTTMSTAPELAGGFALGINGLHYPGDGYLYYDNTDRATFNRIRYDALAGVVTGPVETLVANSFSNVIFDDFTIDFAGNTWLATDSGEVVLLRDVKHGGHPDIEIVASSTTGNFTGLTSAKLAASKTGRRKDSLYATTSGGLLVKYEVAQLGVC